MSPGSCRCPSGEGRQREAGLAEPPPLETRRHRTGGGNPAGPAPLFCAKESLTAFRYKIIISNGIQRSGNANQQGQRFADRPGKTAKAPAGPVRSGPCSPAPGRAAAGGGHRLRQGHTTATRADAASRSMNLIRSRTLPPELTPPEKYTDSPTDQQFFSPRQKFRDLPDGDAAGQGFTEAFPPAGGRGGGTGRIRGAAPLPPQRRAGEGTAARFGDEVRGVTPPSRRTEPPGGGVDGVSRVSFCFCGRSACPKRRAAPQKPRPCSSCPREDPGAPREGARRCPRKQDTHTVRPKPCFALGFPKHAPKMPLHVVSCPHLCRGCRFCPQPALPARTPPSSAAPAVLPAQKRLSTIRWLRGLSDSLKKRQQAQKE